VAVVTTTRPARAAGLLAALGAVLVSALVAGPSIAPAAGADRVVCRFSDARFTEISGMTYSAQHAAVLWLHNDSGGGPVIYAVSAATCRTLATVTITGIEARDLEGIATGVDERGRPVLWLGDIGDNRDSWTEVRLHRIREPDRLVDARVAAQTFRFTYRDRPHDAEAVLASPALGPVWVVTKQLARGRIYRLPADLSSTRLNVARPVTRVGGLVTDGAISPDGTRYVLRDYVNALLYEGAPPGRLVATIPLPLQFQGEAITWTPDGRALLVASERDDRLIRVEIP
jgi:hypothetical protein